MNLGKQKVGFYGIVTEISCDDHEMELQLLELGFREGYTVKILHAALGGDPIAIRIENTITVAIRRKEANYIKVK